MVDAFYSCESNLSCTIRKRSQKATATFHAGQTINFEAVGSKIRCKNFTVRNVVSGDLVLSGTLDANDVKEIKSEIKRAIETVIDVTQDTEKEWGTTPAGQEAYSAAVACAFPIGKDSLFSFLVRFLNRSPRSILRLRARRLMRLYKRSSRVQRWNRVTIHCASFIAILSISRMALI